MSPRARLAFAVAVTVAMGTRSARAQHPRQLNEDAAAVRAALGEAFLNLEATTAEGRVATVARRAAGGLETDAGAWIVSDAAAPFARRLAAALFATSDVATSMTELGAALDTTILGLDVLDCAEGRVLVQRAGSGAANLAAEPGTGRVRELSVVRGDVRWTARALAYGDAGHGWVPTHARVWEGEALVLEISISDAAAVRSDLAPLRATATAPAAAAPLDLPRRMW